MDRLLVNLGRDELDRLISIGPDGSVIADTHAIANAVSRALGVLGVRVAVAALDYLQHENGTPERDTRTASGMWWKSHGDDTADVGAFVIEGQALSLISEGTGQSPLVEDEAIIERATKALASQHEGAEYVEPGLFTLDGPSKGTRVRTLVTRDHRLRRPQDLLEPQDVGALNEGALALVIVQLIGGGKALIVSHGL